MTKSYTLAELAEKTQTKLKGDGSLVLNAVTTLKGANHNQISFVANPKYVSQLQDTQAGAVIVVADLADMAENVLISENPYFTFAQVAQLFAPDLGYKPGIHASAVIGDNCEIAQSASIGPNCVIEDNVKIGEGAVLTGNVFVGRGASIGNGSHLNANVSVYHDCQLGQKVTLASGVVIGSEGFGFAEHKGQWHKVPQLGRVIIEDMVDIGANTTIDRGTLEDTVIHAGVKIDNQVQIAHNVRIGSGTVIAGCVGIAGSTTIGRFCAIGGATAIGGHIELCDQVKLSGMSMVTKSIKQPGIYSSGTGLDENKNWRKNVARFKQLDKMSRRITTLERNSVLEK